MDYTGVRPLLKYQQSPKPLRYMPDGWMQTETKYSRNMKWLGVDRSYTNQYKFVKDGAFIIRTVSYGINHQGLETKLYFLTLRWNPLTGIHEFYNKAEIDLSNLSPDDYLTGVNVNLIDGGPSKYLKAKENVVYDIPCNSSNSDAKQITIDGVQLNASANYSFVDVALSGTNNSNLKSTFAVPLTYLTQEGDSVGILYGSPSYDFVTDFNIANGAWLTNVNNYCNSSSNYLFKSVNALTINLSTTIKITSTNTPPSGISLRFIIKTPTQRFDSSLVFIAPNSSATIVLNQAMTLAANEPVFLLAYEGNSNAFEFNMQQSALNITFDSRNPVSSAYSLTLYDLWKQLIEKLTEGKYNADSTLLANKLNLRATCGDALRGIDTAMIKTSLNDFADLSNMKTLNGAVCIDYNSNTIRFESKEYVFDNSTTLMQLGEVEGFEISIAKEFIYSSIKAGCAVKDATDNLGKQEFNAPSTFTTPITRTNNVLDLVSKYRYDIFAIEQIRSDYFSKDQTSTSKDNDVFIINTETVNGDIIPYRAAYSSITGGRHASTWYNIEEMTPKRVLQANGNMVRMGLYGQLAELIAFRSGERNDNLQTTLNGITTIEKADETISDFNAPFAYPFYFKFKTKVPRNFVPLLQAGNGAIEFTVNGTTLYGFAMDVSQLPVYDEPQEWKLLCSSLTSLQSLISINDVFQLNGLGMISHKNPLKFVPLDAAYSTQFNFRHMDTDWHANRIARYSVKKLFAQKWQTDDNTTLQFITNGTQMNDAIVINCKGKTVGTITPTQISNPAVIIPFQLWHVVINWNIYPPNDTYYVKIDFGVDKIPFISEPNHLKAKWPETLFLQATHDTNHPDMIFNAPYEIKLRFEGMIHKFEPKLKSESYEDQVMDIETLNSQPYRMWELIIGTQYGTPDWLIDKLNRALPLNDLRIDGTAYAIDKGAQLERKEIPGSPYAFWSIPIREKNTRAGIDIEQNGINEKELTVMYNIETVGFSSIQNPNANQQSNVVQIEDIS